MNAPDQFIDEFITEIKASLSQPDSAAMLRRLNAERLLQLTVDELINSNQADNIHFLPDNRLSGKTGADFLLQIDDYDFRLEILDAPEEQPTLSTQKLSAMQRLLEDNPGTVALILVWTTDELLSIPLSVARIRYISENPAQMDALLRAAKPLAQTLQELIDRQVKNWEKHLGEAVKLDARLIDTRTIFDATFTDILRRERSRPYRQPGRKEAAARYPEKTERKLVFETLDEALNGAPANDLITRLTRLPRRGVQ